MKSIVLGKLDPLSAESFVAAHEDAMLLSFTSDGQRRIAGPESLLSAFAEFGGIASSSNVPVSYETSCAPCTQKQRLKAKPLGESYAIPEEPSDIMECRDPSEWFDEVICISLARSPVRWDMFERNIAACDWPFREPQKFNAIDGKICKPPIIWTVGEGAWGCYRSHIRLMEEVLMSGSKSVLIMEDDAEPVLDFGAKVRSWQTGIPSNWKGLWFGGEHFTKRNSDFQKINPQTVKCSYVTRTHCYGLRQPFLGEFYRFLTDCKQQLGNTTQHIDHAIARFMAHGKHALYAPAKEWLVAQAESKSDITNRNEPKRMFQ